MMMHILALEYSRYNTTQHSAGQHPHQTGTSMSMNHCKTMWKLAFSGCSRNLLFSKQ